MSKEFLIGVNPLTLEICTGEVKIKEYDGHKELSVCFNLGSAFDVDEIDLKQDCEIRWDMYDAQTKLDYLDDGEKTKDEVFEEWIDENDYRYFRDCSCTDYEMELSNGQTINFETIACGQYDIREQDNYNKIIFTDKKAVKRLLELWDNYQLKTIDEKIENEVNDIVKRLQSFDIEEFVKNIIVEV